MLYNALLDVFLETAKVGSFSAAAKNLFLTQPALTHQIKTLEKSMGVKLFVRTPKGVSLSKAGQVLLENAEGLKAMCTHLENECVRVMTEEEQCIRIGVSMDDQYPVLRQIHTALLAEHPEISIRFVLLELSEMYRALVSGKVDIIIHTPARNAEPDSRVSFHHVARLLQCVMVPPEHALARKPFLLMSDLRNETLLVPRFGMFDDVDDLINYIRLREPAIRLKETDYDITTRYQCQMDQTLLLSPMLFSETCDPLVSIPLHCSFTTSFGLLCRSEHPAAVDRYIEAALEVFREYRHDTGTEE